MNGGEHTSYRHNDRWAWACKTTDRHGQSFLSAFFNLVPCLDIHGHVGIGTKDVPYAPPQELQLTTGAWDYEHTAMAEHTRVAMAEKDGEADEADEANLDPADGGPVEAAPLASTLIPTSIAASIAASTATLTTSLTSTPSPPPPEPQNNDLPRTMTLHHTDNAPLEEEHEEGIEYALDYFGELEPDCATGYEAGDAGAVVEGESEVCEEPLEELYEYDWVDEVLAF